MLKTVVEPILFRVKADQYAGRFAMARDNDLVRRRLSKKPRQIVFDFGQGNFLHSRLANCASHDSASDLATIAKTSAVVPETLQVRQAEMGFSLVLYANAALQGAVHGMQSTLSALKQKGVLDERAVTSFAERQRLVDKQAFDLMEARYAARAASENG